MFAAHGFMFASWAVRVPAVKEQTGASSAALGLALLNIGIGGLSLLPVHPLDGHKLIVGLVWWAVGSEDRARRIIRRTGIALLAVDASSVALLLAAKPLIGVTVAALAAVRVP